MSRPTILALPGDGIGPEVVAAALGVLVAVRPDVETVAQPIGLAALDEIGRPFDPSLLDVARRSDAILLGAVGGNQESDGEWDLRPEAALFTLRKGLDLYANVRPVKLLDALRDRAVLRSDLIDDVDLVIVRELVGGAYFGAKGERDDGVVFDTFEYTGAQVERVIRRAFALASGRSRKVASVDKANILRTSVLWRSLAEKVSSEYPDIACEHLLVDNAAMQLLMRPSTFDVVVTENLFGDILSDEAAAIVGGLGMLPSASLSDVGPGLFEPVHGSAPDIAGQGIANPTASILTVALLLRHGLGDADNADRVERAVEVALDTVRTRDIGGSDGTDAVVAAVLAAL
jgi:3-isopropylmalate dehydrogenase